MTLLALDKKLRIATLNFLHNIEDLDNRARILAEEVNRLELDVLSLQEVPYLPYPFSPVLDKLEALTGLKTVATNQHDEFPNRDAGLAILSSLPKLDAASLYLDGDYASTVLRKISEDPLAARLQTPSGQAIEVINAHLSWGGHRENARLKQLIRINQHAKRAAENAMSVYLAGDLNTLPSSMSTAYLRGEYVPESEEEGTYWIDSWDLLRSEEQGTTTSGRGYWSKQTAARWGIHLPELIPDRRIDYIFTYGWTYGKLGTPLQTGQFANELATEISDHKGVWVDILDGNV